VGNSKHDRKATFGVPQVLPGNLMDLGILLFVVSIAGNERTTVHPAHSEDGKAVAKGN
jgi:hypothetical protein